MRQAAYTTIPIARSHSRIEPPLAWATVFNAPVGLASSSGVEVDHPDALAAIRSARKPAMR